MHIHTYTHTHTHKHTHTHTHYTHTHTHTHTLTQECSVECGFGTYSRNVFCTEHGTAYTVVIEDGFCDPRFRPAETSRCIVRNCPGEQTLFFILIHTQP